MSIDFEKEIGKFQEDADPAKAGLARLLIQASKTWRDLYGEVKSPKEVSQAKQINKSLVQEFITGPLTPELVTATSQTLWQSRGEKVGLNFIVSPCDRTVEELVELAEKGRRMSYLPEQLMTQEQRPLLGQIFPELRSYSVQAENSVMNEENRFGWFDYDAGIDASYRNTTENTLRTQITAEGRLGMNLNEYIVASEDSKLFTGKFLDQDNTWVRLLGSRGDGGVVNASFYSDGGLLVGWGLRPGRQLPGLGGRSVGVKRI